jgi:hypothetical protein
MRIRSKEVIKKSKNYYSLLLLAFIAIIAIIGIIAIISHYFQKHTRINLMCRCHIVTYIIHNSRKNSLSFEK